MTPRALPAPVRRAIVAHARRDAPRECCGFLIGLNGRVQFAWPMKNAARRPTVRYQIDDRQHIDLRRFLRRLAPPLEIVGVYHSHPEGVARPSPADCDEAHYPDWLIAIVGLRRGQGNLGLFRIVGGRVRRIGRRGVPRAAV